MATNGRLAASDLALIPGGVAVGGGSARVRRDLLPGVIGLQAAFLARFGAPLRPTSAADGYRSYDQQTRVFLERYEPTALGSGPYGDVRWWNGTRYVRLRGPSAAVPGTSNHGWAVAIDWSGVGAKGSTRWNWLMANAPRFGWTNPLWARDGKPGNGSEEPWHWEGVVVPVANYRDVPGVTAPDITGTLPGSLTPLTSFEETDMRDYLIALYLKTLGRLPDVAGYATHLSDVATGRKTWAQLERELEASPESAAFAALGSEAARNAKRAESGFTI